MELINKSHPQDKLYRVNETDSYTRERIINHKVNEAMKILPEHWRDRNFSMVTNETLKIVCDKLKQWDFKTPIISSLISKQNGIGKSFIGTCLIRKYFYDRIAPDFDEYFVEWNEHEAGMYYGDGKVFLRNTYYHEVSILDDKKLHMEIQETFAKKKTDSQKNILDKYVGYKFLVIDDMFSNRSNEFARQNILYVIDERTEYLNRPTFITSNLTIDEIADIDTRIADRINNSMLFQIDKPIESYRSKK